MKKENISQHLNFFFSQFTCKLFSYLMNTCLLALSLSPHISYTINRLKCNKKKKYICDDHQNDDDIKIVYFLLRQLESTHKPFMKFSPIGSDWLVYLCRDDKTQKDMDYVNL